MRGTCVRNSHLKIIASKHCHLRALHQRSGWAAPRIQLRTDFQPSPAEPSRALPRIFTKMSPERATQTRLLQPFFTLCTRDTPPSQSISCPDNQMHRSASCYVTVALRGPLTTQSSANLQKTVTNKLDKHSNIVFSASFESSRNASFGVRKGICERF